MITIDARALGKRQALVPAWSIPFPPEWPAEGAPVTLRELIARVVRSEVEAFRQRQEERRLLRVLTAAEVADGEARGKIASGGSDLLQEVDAEAAVTTALQAFEDGLYLVLIDGDEARELDRELFVRPESRITFLRLALLAGG